MALCLGLSPVGAFARPVDDAPLGALSLPSGRAPVCELADPVAQWFRLGRWPDGREGNLVVEGVASVRIAAGGDGVIEVTRRGADGTGYAVRGTFVEDPLYLAPEVEPPGVVAPTSEVPLALVGADRTLTLRLMEAPPFLDDAEDGLLPPTFEARCEDVRLGWRPAARRLADEQARPTEPESTANTIGISAEAGGEVLFWYAATRGGATGEGPGRQAASAPTTPVVLGPHLQISERRGQQVHVRFYAAGFVVDGWTDWRGFTRRTQPFEDVDQRGPEAPHRSLDSLPGFEPAVRRCPSDLALYQLGPEPVQVGVLFAGTAFSADPLGARSDFVAVSIDGVGTAARAIIGSDPFRLHARAQALDCAVE